MAAKEESPGLLNKVARLVGLPGSTWSAGEGKDSAQVDSGFGKQALREMIERRQRNDFVRRREFEQLRRLRRNGLVPADGGDETSRLSVLDSGFSSRQHDRESTLRKIDEIEEQMSRQWWKTRPPGIAEQRVLDSKTGIAQLGRRRSDRVARRLGASSSLFPSSHTASTGFAATARGAINAVGALAPPDLDLPDASFDPLLEAAKEASRLRALAIAEMIADLPEYSHEPLFEDAAIRFVNADFAGAEQALRSLVDNPANIATVNFWNVLFDFYRASGRHDRYEAMSIEFAERFGRSAPTWFSLAVVRQPAPMAPDQAGLKWRCPVSLGALDIASLVRRADLAAQPWVLDWSALEALRDDAAEPLQAALTAWSRQPLALHFIQAERLTRALRLQAPDDDSSANPVWWQARMELLRLLRQPDEFERVALDYCIAYEVSPPSWVRPVCNCVIVRVEGAMPDEFSSPIDAPPSNFGVTDFALSIPGDGSVVLPAKPQPLAVPVVALAGDLAGEADHAVAELDAALARSGGVAAIIIDCDRLARIDFTAAGSLLNWAAARHGEGVTIQFRHLHRLIAAFVNVVGLQEFARLHVRVD